MRRTSLGLTFGPGSGCGRGLGVPRGGTSNPGDTGQCRRGTSLGRQPPADRRPCLTGCHPSGRLGTQECGRFPTLVSRDARRPAPGACHASRPLGHAWSRPGASQGLGFCTAGCSHKPGQGFAPAGAGGPAGATGTSIAPRAAVAPSNGALRHARARIVPTRPTGPRPNVRGGKPTSARRALYGPARQADPGRFGRRMHAVAVWAAHRRHPAAQGRPNALEQAA